MARLQEQTVHLRELAAQLRVSASDTGLLSYQTMLRHAADDLESEAERRERDDQLLRMR